MVRNQKPELISYYIKHYGIYRLKIRFRRQLENLARHLSFIVDLLLLHRD